MAIEPNTTIKVYHGVPLDMNQDRSIAWANISEQNTYFHANNSNILKYTFSQTTYQRVRKGVMRVERKADDLYDCNYMAFQNTNFGNKWFYAFITSVEYVNDITSEVTFVIDELQTWFFEMTLQPCMIERCHTTTDVIGEHIEPEPVQLGEYVMNYVLATVDEQTVATQSYAPIGNWSDLCVIIAIVDVTQTTVSGKVYDGVYGSATLFAYKQNDTAAINQKIANYLTKPDSIISIYMAPSELLRGIITLPIPDGGREIPDRYAPISSVFQDVALDKNNTLLDMYKPRNAKLYTYPYNYYHVDNSNGSSLCLRYEFFKDLRPTLEIRGTFTQPVELMLRPCRYKNSDPFTYDPSLTSQYTLNTETLTLTTYPLCSWNTDGFQAWMVNTGIPYGINVAGGAVDTLTSLAMAGAMGATGEVGMASALGESGATGAATNMATSVMGFGFGKKAAGLANAFYQASIQSDISRGNFSNANANCAIRKQTFFGGRCSITAEYARMIDDFFDKYGYAINRLQTPNLRARPHWSYVQTKECAITGNLPVKSKEAIKSYFNNGITFWKLPSEVGNYTLNNRV